MVDQSKDPLCIGLTPLKLCARLNCIPVMKLLLQRRVSLRPGCHDSVLGLAVGNGCVEALQLLLKCFGADPLDLFDGYHEHILSKLAADGNVNMLYSIVRFGEALWTRKCTDPILAS